MLDIYEASLGSVRRLAAIRRYSSMHVARPENVAEHMGYACLYALMVSQDLAERGHRVDIGQVLARTVVHDLDEAMSGDIMRGFKYSNDTILRAIEATSAQNMEALVREFGGGMVSDDILKFWEDAKDDSLEGEIVRFVDLLCVIAYCREEKAMGNSLLDDIIRGAYRAMRNRYIMQLHPNLDPFEIYFRQIFPNDEWTDVFRAMPGSWMEISAKA